MHNLTHDRLLSKNFIVLKLLTAAYAVGLVVSHAVAESEIIWPLAIFFSIAMNFTYPWAAYQQKVFVTTEFAISVGLISLSLLSIVSSPLFVILAIFLHGAWDTAKHKRSLGAPFFSWYVNGCSIADFIYSASLLLYYCF